VQHQEQFLVSDPVQPPASSVVCYFWPFALT